MIQRVVTVKLKPEYRDPPQLEAVLEATEVLRDAEGVLDLRVATAADGRTAGEWDLCILVQLADLAAVERYRTDRVHRAYADEFLRPIRESIRVWNFELGADTD